VRLGERLLTFPTRKTLALLIFRALEGAQPREHLAILLWQDSSPERSHGSLRNTPQSSANCLVPGPAVGLKLATYLSVTRRWR
jgi:hypothetical protein